MRGRPHSNGNSRDAPPQRKVKTKTAAPVVARKRGRPRKTEGAVSHKVLIPHQPHESNRVTLAPDDLQGRVRELAKLARNRATSPSTRSEERRVGKEWRAGWEP